MDDEGVVRRLLCVCRCGVSIEKLDGKMDGMCSARYLLFDKERSGETSDMDGCGASTTTR
jgi:hypothetical protein